MSKSRRKQESDISRLVGILVLEVVGAILLLNLAGFAHEQRTEAETRRDVRQPELVENSLPKMANRRYNARW